VAPASRRCQERFDTGETPVPQIGALYIEFYGRTGRMFAMARWWIKSLAVLLTLGWSSAALACDLCRDAVATNTGSGSESSSLNFNTSIFFMFGVLFAVMGLIGRVMFKATRGR
jgi:hypothetical protein